MRLSKTALGTATVGHVVNLLSNDVNRFDTSLLYLNYVWIGPVQTIVVTYFLWQEIEVSSIFGVAALIIFIPLQSLYRKTNFKLKIDVLFYIKTLNRYFDLKFGWGKKLVNSD